MIFQSVKMIQEGEAAIFYRFNRELKGYMIAGVFIAKSLKAKMDFAKVWKYFASEIVRDDDIYCSIMLGSENSMFENYLDYYDTLEGIKIYKVDNYIKDKYSNYARHKESAEVNKHRRRSGG